MKIRSVVALVGLVIGFTVPTFAQQKDTPVDPRLTQQLNALNKKFDDAFNNNDAAAVAALFTKDGVMVTNSGPIYGPEVIEKYQAEAFKEGHINKADQYGAHMIGTDGKMAWRTGEWSLTWQGKTGDPVPLKGYWTCIEVLDTDGVWKDKVQTWNITPAPATTKTAAAETK